MSDIVRGDAWLGSGIGYEPAIAITAPSGYRATPRGAVARWLAGIILIACAGGSFLALALDAALDTGAVALRAPEIVGQRDSRQPGAAEERGDSLFRMPDIAAEKHTFTAPVATADKPLIRSRGFARITTTLTLARNRFADQVPRYDPGASTSNGEDGGAPDADPGAAPETTDVTLRSEPLTDLDGASAPAPLTEAEIAAQVDRFVQLGEPAAASLVLAPPSRDRTAVAGADPDSADAGVVRTSLPLLDISMVPENVTTVPRSRPSRQDGTGTSERLVVIREGDSLEALLRDNGADAAQVASMATALGAKPGRAAVEDGRRLRLTLASLDGVGPRRIVRLSVLSDTGPETTIAADDRGRYRRVDQPTRRPGDSDLENGPSADSATGDDDGLTIYDSLYETALKQGMPQPLIATLIRVVGDDVDLKRSVAAGDTLDAFYSDGNASGHNHLLFVSLTVRGETHRYYRFRSAREGEPDYFDEQGRSVRKFLIREPVPSARISSPFGVRSHPILGYSRPHNGVDFAAPSGTPILAAGTGTVRVAIHSPSYGNHVEIQHENGYVTTYSHMAAFARGIAGGVPVRQGQVVGYIGQTGLATGPHLHYEVIVNGHYVDPMRVRLGRTVELSGEALDAYGRERARIDGLMRNGMDGLQASNLPRR